MFPIKNFISGFLGTSLLIFLFAGVYAAAEPLSVPMSLQNYEFSSDLIPRGIHNTPFAYLHFTTPEGKFIRVERLVLKQFGTIENSAIKRVSLLNEQDELLAGPESLTGGIVSFEQGFLLDAGERHTLKLTFNLEDNASIGDTIGFQILSADAVRIEGPASAPAMVTANFPLKTQLMVVTEAGLNSMVRVNLETANIVPTQIASNTKDVSFGELVLQVHGEKDVRVQKILLTKTGSMQNSFFHNVRLQGAAQNIVASTEDTEDKAFLFEPNLTIHPQETAELRLLVDIVKDIPEGSTLGFEIAAVQDLEIRDTDTSALTKMLTTFPIRTPLKTVALPIFEVQLRSDMMSSEPLRQGESGTVVAVLNLSAAGKNMTLTKLAFQKTGSIPVSALKNISLTDETNTILFSPQNIINEKIFFSQHLEFLNGEQKTLLLKADIGPNTPIDSTFGVKIASAEDVEARTLDTDDKAEIQGAFPLSSPLRKVAAATTEAFLDVALLPYENFNQTFTNNSSHAALCRIIFTPHGADLEAQKISFTFSGTATPDDFENFRLMDAQGNVLNTAVGIEENRVIFILRQGLRTEEAREFVLVADVAVDTEESMPTVELQLTGAQDLLVKEMQTEMIPHVNANFPIQIRFRPIQPVPTESFLDTSLEPLPLGNGHVELDQNNIRLGRLTFRAFGDDILITRFLLQQIGNTSKKIFENIRLTNEQGEKITQREDLENGLIYFEQSLEVSAETPLVVFIEADIHSEAQPGYSGHLEISTASYIIAKRGSHDLAVTGNFPLRSSTILIPSKQRFSCTAEDPPICGRQYDTCDTFPCAPVETTYANMCELQRHYAFLLAMNSCAELDRRTYTFTALQIPGATYQDTVLQNYEEYEHPFPDVNRDSLEGKAVLELFRRQSVGGFPDGEFKGDFPVNRAEAAKILLTTRFGEEETPPYARKFVDVPIEQWFTKYVLLASAKGIINGYPDKTFKPEDTINTAEFLKMLALTFGLESELPFRYHDVAGDAWFAPYAGSAQKYELFPRREDKMLEPEKAITRNEMVVAIYQWLQLRNEFEK